MTFQPKVPYITHDCHMSDIMHIAIQVYLKYYKTCLMYNSKTTEFYFGLPNTAHYAKRADDEIRGIDSHNGGVVDDVNACIASLFFYILQVKATYNGHNQNDIHKTFMYVMVTLLKLTRNLQSIPKKDKATVINTLKKSPAPMLTKKILIKNLKGELKE